MKYFKTGENDAGNGLGLVPDGEGVSYVGGCGFVIKHGEVDVLAAKVMEVVDDSACAGVQKASVERIAKKHDKVVGTAEWSAVRLEEDVGVEFTHGGANGVDHWFGECVAGVGATDEPTGVNRFDVYVQYLA